MFEVFVPPHPTSRCDSSASRLVQLYHANYSTRRGASTVLPIETTPLGCRRRHSENIPLPWSPYHTSRILEPSWMITGPRIYYYTRNYNRSGYFMSIPTLSRLHFFTLIILLKCARGRHTSCFLWCFTWISRNRDRRRRKHSKNLLCNSRGYGKTSRKTLYWTYWRHSYTRTTLIGSKIKLCLHTGLCYFGWVVLLQTSDIRWLSYQPALICPLWLVQAPQLPKYGNKFIGCTQVGLRSPSKRRSPQNAPFFFFRLPSILERSCEQATNGPVSTGKRINCACSDIAPLLDRHIYIYMYIIIPWWIIARVSELVAWLDGSMIGWDVTFSWLGVNREWLSLLLVVGWTGKTVFSLSPFAPEILV